VIHDGIPYDLIQGQGHGGMKVVNMANFKVYFHRYACNQTTSVDLSYSNTISKF